MSYLHTIRQYWRNPKGRHDIKDYGRALLLMLLTSLVIFAVVYVVSDSRGHVWVMK